MSFFVVERGRGGASLRIPLPQGFESREVALEALSTALATGEVAIDGELFVVDLAAAVPVLLMPGAGAPAPAIEADSTNPVSPDVPTMPELPAEVVYDAWAEAVTETQSGDGLADALKRAASSLESEGIVAPASIEAEPTSGTGVWSKAASSEVVEPVSSIGFVGETPEVPDGPAEGGSWPWTNVAPVEGEETIAEERDLVAETVAAFEEEGSEDLSMLTSVPEGGDAYLPKPVILGDYDEPAASAADADGVLAALVSADEAALEYVTLPGADALEEDVEEVAPADNDEVEADSPSAPMAPVAAETVDGESAAAGYEAGAELDLGAYTCDDCVYSNTCPKVGQSAPAECGSFQWRSE